MSHSTRTTGSPTDAVARWLKARPLRRAFYNRGADVVAKQLLGCVLVRRRGRGLLAGRIVETEAYVGEDDRACHANRGRTRRNAVMYEAPGRAYVYFIYGVHDMLNVVCRPPGVPEAVLIRGVEPVHGLDSMRRRRGVRRLQDVASGPGKLCRAFAITRKQNGMDLAGPVLWITAGRLRATETISTSARVGVDYAGEDARRPLRFFVSRNPHVSRPRSTGAPSRRRSQPG